MSVHKDKERRIYF